ncbi:hypothetical protein, partial [Acidicapsa ligni]|uniref:hypothetical protein n=1 Tax=Acidicapsa ligni TaxID=542300 RepID=UPI0021E0DEA8
LFDETGSWPNVSPGELLETAQALDPRTVSAVAVLAQETTGEEIPTVIIFFLQAQPDTVGQRLLDFGKLVLPLVILFVLLGVFLQSLFVLQRIVMVVDTHDAIERVGERPVECGLESRRFYLERFNGRLTLR